MSNSNKTGNKDRTRNSNNVSFYDPLNVSSQIVSVQDDQPQTYGETWTKKIEALLTILFHNCKYLSKYHNYRYHKCRFRLKLFRIPIIILSAVNAYTAIGLQPYTLQSNISTINSVISLICGIITSIEMFLNTQKKMEKELQSHVDFNVLSVEIMKMLLLDVTKRNQDGRVFLDEKFSCFLKFTENGNAMNPNYFVDVFDITDMERMNQKIKTIVQKEIKTDKKLPSAKEQITPDIENYYMEEDQHINSNHYFEMPEFLTIKGIKKMYNPQLYDLKQEKKQCSSHVKSMSNAISPVKNVNNLKRNHSIDLITNIKRDYPDIDSEIDIKNDIDIENDNENESNKFETIPFHLSSLAKSDTESESDNTSKWWWLFSFL